MRKLSVGASLLLACGLVCLMVGGAAASPLFGIHSLQEWEAAVNSGQVRAVPGTEFQDMVRGGGAYAGLQLADGDGWPLTYQEAEFLTPQLDVAEYEGEAGLVMAWGDQTTAQDLQQAAAWDFVYDEDPNLDGTIIEFSIFPPVYCTQVSLNLIDMHGNYREWIWHAGDTGEMIPGQWNLLQINPSAGTSNWPTVAGTPFIYQDPSNPFDINSIQFLRFNENISSNSPGWPSGPAGVPPGWIWNMWNHVEVHPEPATMALLGSGLLGLVLKRRKRK